MKLLASDDGGALVRVIAGDVERASRAPVRRYTPITLAHATIQPGARLNVPWNREFNALVYVLAGDGAVGPTGQPDPAGPAGRHGTR